MAWGLVGSVRASATTLDPIPIGYVSAPSVGGLEIRAVQTAPAKDWSHGYGLLWMENEYGRELGTVTIHGHRIGESYRLGLGLSCRAGGGNLFFFPRFYNLRWLKYNPEWAISFYVDQPVALPPDRFRSPGFETSSRFRLPLILSGLRGRLRF
jgi:hypothetical protein